MLNYSLILNIGLIIAILYLMVALYTQTKYNRVLLVRAWSLELKLIAITAYSSCSDEIRTDIKDALSRIKSL